MGSHPLRQDKKCQNCGHVVEMRYCPKCGQENTETRQSFGHLFAHFFEDFTHYDNAFWKTIKYLCFRPARLTKAYLSGRRMSFVPPVRLYIFISFITFFLMSILPDANDSEKKSDAERTAAVKTIPHFEVRNKGRNYYKLGDGYIEIGDYKSVRELDSAQAKLPTQKKLGTFEYWIEKRLAQINEQKHKRSEFVEKMRESIIHNLPKALFLYLPFFAFALWLFHGKKRWFYFDHGIFTLHYFSFILLTFSVFLILESSASFIDGDLQTMLFSLGGGIMGLWWIFYFFRSHRKMYGESKLISRLKSLALFIINLFFLIVFMIGLILFSLLSIQ